MSTLTSLIKKDPTCCIATVHLNLNFTVDYNQNTYSELQTNDAKVGGKKIIRVLLIVFFAYIRCIYQHKYIHVFFS